MYVLAGGSNMDGRANADELTAWNLERVRNASARVRLSYKGGISADIDSISAKDSRDSRTWYNGPLTSLAPNDVVAAKFRLKRAFGPELFFGTKMAEDNPTDRFKLVKHSFGGSRLVNASWSHKVPALRALAEWSPGDWRAREVERKGLGLPRGSFRMSASTGSGESYEGLIQDVLERLRNDESTVVSGVLWVHGEIECRDPEAAGQYADALAEVVAGMRSDLGMPELLFAMLMPWPYAHLEPALPEFLSSLHALERTLPHFRLVRAADPSGLHPLEVYADRYASLEESPFAQAPDVFNHYTEAGMRAAGELLATHARGIVV